MTELEKKLKAKIPGEDTGIQVRHTMCSITVCVHPTLSVPEGLVNLFHGYSEADANLLTDSDHLDPYSGFPAYRSIRCAVRKEG